MLKTPQDGMSRSSVPETRPTPQGGEREHPLFRATSIFGPKHEFWSTCLSEQERARLISVATVVGFNKGDVLYRVGEPYTDIYIVLSGAVKTYRFTSDGRCAIAAFLFAQDVVGLGEGGFYVNTAEAVEEMRAYRLPAQSLERLLRTESHLEILFLCKVCNELRSAQQHALVLANHSARAKVAQFLRLIEARSAGPAAGTIHLPMGRSDIADFLGLSVEAVSRAFRGLEKEGVLAFHGPRAVTVVDAQKFHDLVAALD